MKEDKKIKKEKDILRQTDELEELFFYTLYGFKACWIAGQVSDYTAKRIFKNTRLSLKGYELKLFSNDLKHFLNSHFHELHARQRDITFDDISKLLRVVNSFTYVEFGNKPNTLLFITNFPNGIFELVVVINHKQKTLSGKSLRIKA